MKVNYDSEADVLSFIISNDPPVDSIEESGGIIISYNQEGKPVTIEFLNASQHNIINQNELSITFKTENLAVA
jgi:uncharacterized protein YuzE